ncbi:MAG: efflux RND transporter permease subunit [Proteobacteria bacterium]|nr:efflux RND transporter permease subunit [Pseudomonadota bacterium]
MNLPQISIQRPIFITMVTTFLLVLGLLGFNRLSLDLYPSLTYPVLSVRTDFKGAAPEEIEQLLSRPIEDALSTVADVATIRSVSREGTSIVILEFNQGADIKFQEMQVRAKVGNIRRRLPEAASEPVVARQDPDDTPIIEIAMTGKRPSSELSKLAEDVVARRIRQIEGVGDVSLRGERKEEIQVELNPVALQVWRLNATDIVQAIGKSNRNEPVGKLEGKERTWVLRSVGAAKTIEDLRNTPVGRAASGLPLQLRDVAEVTEGYAERDNISKLGTRDSFEPSVILEIVKQSGENTVAVVDKIRGILKEMESLLPDDVSLHVIRDNSTLIRSNVADVQESLIIACALTIIVVLLFMRSPRSTVTTGLALPSSVITTFAMMAAAGFSMNVMTLLALSLSIGLLVDDAIVVRENIYRHLQMPDADPRKAALEGTNEVVLAVLATTLVVVAVFLPVGFMSGVTGQFFKPFALTVVFAMLVSLWDAVTMGPMLSAYFANIPHPVQEWKKFGATGLKINSALEGFEHSFERLALRYQRTLVFLLKKPWIAALIAVVSIAVAAAGFFFVEKSFLPTQLGETFTAQLDGPPSLRPEAVEPMGDVLHERLKTIDAIDLWTISTGTNAWGLANIRVNVHIADRFAKSQKMLARVRQDVRQALSGFAGYTVRINEPADPLSSGGARFQPVAVIVAGDNQTELMELAKRVRSELQQTKGISDAQPLQEDGVPEVVFKPNPQLTAQYGLTNDVLLSQLAVWVQGDATNDLSKGDEKIPVRVRLRDARYSTPYKLAHQGIVVRSGGGSAVVPLGNMINIEMGSGPATIIRENRQRVLRIGGNILPDAALGSVVAELKERLGDIPLSSGQSLTVKGQNQQMDELFRNLAVALALGLVFVYMVLASLFESFLQPFTVMLAIPLAATGAVLALLATQFPLDLYGGIGVILLAGICAKNSILLIDFAMQKIRSGEQAADAIVSSAPLRLRPILMTSVAMIVGMLPVATGWGAGGAARMPLGIATIGGVVSSTLLTLFVVPNFFVFIEKMRRIKSQAP